MCTGEEPSHASSESSDENSGFTYALWAQGQESRLGSATLDALVHLLTAIIVTEYRFKLM